jgi:hypothetical protein
MSDINDIRGSPAFNGISFSGYKKTEVKNQFVENMLKGKIEPACHWSAELICSGHLGDVWDSIFYYVGKYIHIGNPKIAIYLEKRYNVFRNIMNQGHFTSELQLRNNDTIRRMFAEIITIVSQSPKKASFESIKIKREEEFDITQMTDRLKAPSITFAEPIIHKDDPKELLISINEFAYHIGGDKPNMMLACYWVEWIIEFELICRKRREPCICKRRNISVETKYQCDVIWIIWDALTHYANKRGGLIETVMNSLQILFAAKYTIGTPKKRKYLLYFAVELLTEHVPTNVDIVANKEILTVVTSKIDIVYKNIKKNEVSPNTDYLFSSTDTDKQANFENSVKKMELLGSLDFVPRNNG